MSHTLRGAETHVVDRSAGRPRDTSRHVAVLTATRELLAEAGYAALNFSEIASRAGVTRQLLYRWWPNRAALVSEAIFAYGEESRSASYPGPFEHDLRAFITTLVEYACRPAVRAGIIGLMSESESVTELPGLESGMLHALETDLDSIVARAAERGEIASGIDVRLTLNTLRGAIVMHLIADRTPPDVIVEHLTMLTTRAFEWNTPN
ncbi:TetR/AcrR family transcriptional regulator [Prescottella agglutinans]|uniref:AcrR family transcriptional regulator n=1 Tax=Prescottella agglutinans TaxID=1644129 RepID=A0ABT6MAI7_9NOCA|nr:TetR/AcrR family transcriptional regulator [Prescottella agglutinans]MDH6280949.1 AcrR family transcriptional regulator [Prescottella agglutinans]